MNIAARTRDKPELPSGGAFGYPDTFWRSLTQLNAFRFFLAVFFAASVFFPESLQILGGLHQEGLLLLACTYLAATAVFRSQLRHRFPEFNLQLLVQLITDIAVISAFIYFGNGNAAGLGLLLTVPMAAAGLHPKTRMMLFLASLGSLAVLIEQGLTNLALGDVPGREAAGGYLHAALLSLGFFTVAAISHFLAKGALASAQVADEKGREASELERINAKVIQDLPYGVLVLDHEGRVVLRNQKAETLFHCSLQVQSGLPDCNRELDTLRQEWLLQGGPGTAVLTVGEPPSRLRVRLKELGAERGEGAMVIVEDLSELEQEAMQMKLAALGRLTANLAHEIRNPLSAVNHAAQLLREDAGKDPSTERLTRIIEDNAARLNYLVEDVLALSKRDRQNRETIRLDEYLPDFISQFEQTESVADGVICQEIGAGLRIDFDRVHLNQILWNLMRNAHRHCSRLPCGIVVRAAPVGDTVQIEIYNDGPAIPPELRQRLFEPFFSTDRTGTGLGLYIALELAEANEAQLRCVEQTQGACFRLTAKLLS